MGPNEVGFGKIVRFIGCSKEQKNWGGCDDQNEVLKPGDCAFIEDYSVHSYHTKIKLFGEPGWYNSVCFEPFQG